MGALPGHLGVAHERAGIGAVDFVEDQLGGSAVELGVAEDQAAQLSGPWGFLLGSGRRLTLLVRKNQLL